MAKLFWGLGIEHEVNWFTGQKEMRLSKIEERMPFAYSHSTEFVNAMLKKLGKKSAKYPVYERMGWTTDYHIHLRLLLLAKLGKDRFIKETGESPEAVDQFQSSETPLSAEDLEHWNEEFKKDKTLLPRLTSLAKVFAVDYSLMGEYPEFATSDYKRAKVSTVLKELETAEKTFKQFVNIWQGHSLWQAEVGNWPFIEFTDQRNYKPEEPKGISFDYNGSYHINITLPCKLRGKQITKDFADRHMKAMRILQWLEPLFVAAWGQPDCFSVLDHWNATEGSYRMINNEHSGLGTRDLSQSSLEALQSDRFRNRYVPAPWIPRSVWHEKGFAFRDAAIPTRLPAHIRNTRQALAGYGYQDRMLSGADFRRDQPEPFGFEFRILDHFPTRHLHSVLHIILLFCDHSASMKSEDIPDPRENVDWDYLTREVMLEGWNARVTLSQIMVFVELMGLQVKDTKRIRTAFDLFKLLVDAAWKNYGQGKGEYTRHMLSKSDQKRKPKLVNLNRMAWRKFSKLWLDRKPSLKLHSSLEENEER